MNKVTAFFIITTLYWGIAFGGLYVGMRRDELQAAQQPQLPVLDCKTARAKAGVIVKNYEGKVFRVDVCAVAESPDGEDFRYAQ